jgi:hypothetical protein
MDKLAPIVLFVYNRPEHTLRCLESLSENVLAKQSTLHIFCDGPKENASISDLKKISEVEEVVKKKKWCGEVFIHSQLANLGLRNSVISGVSKIINDYGNVIVIEDDLVLSNHFLSYMNNGLNKYQSNSTVCQISGFSFPLDITELKEDAYFLPLTTTWGWATWKHIWNEVNFDGTDYQKILPDKKSIKAFNLENAYNYYSMLQKQMLSDKTISSWGIMFWLHAFKHNYVVLFPKYSLTTNTGFDGTGMHKTNDSSKKKDNFSLENNVNIYPESDLPNEKMFTQLKIKISREENSIQKKVLRLYNRVFK